LIAARVAYGIPFFAASLSRSLKNISIFFKFGFEDVLTGTDSPGEETTVGAEIVSTGVTIDGVVVEFVVTMLFVDAEKELSLVLVYNPTYPLPSVSPAGLKISLAYLFWNRMTAAFVSNPK
jgi:hypothetical protein